MQYKCRDGAALIKVAALSALMLCAAPQGLWAGQCNDGIDNDADGKIDALVEANTAGTWIRSFTYQPDGLVDAVNQRLALMGQPPFYKPSGHSYAFYFDQVTASRVCQLLGYGAVKAMDCKYPEKYSSTGFRCTFYNGGDLVYQWTGSRWVSHPARFWTDPKAPPWISSLVCADPLPECRDLIDNDKDGKVDFPADTGCFSQNDLSETVHDPKCKTPADPTEFEQCRDGIDNDRDDLIDVKDPGCWSNIGDPATYDPNLDDEGRATSQCRDGKDNDGDGKIDHPADPGCDSPQDYSEDNPIRACNNGLDDDRDGLIDYPADPGCNSAMDDSERNPYGPQCDNDKDDDGDGRIDYPDDPGCNDARDDDERDPKTPCTDGIDNDADGYIDYEDDGCPASGGTSECHISLTPCDNCKDDDGDGKIDMKDPCCRVPWGGSESACDAPIHTQCNDKIDNDGDGYIDYYDDGCFASGGKSECHISLTSCDNCIDDDGDGLIDMRDPSCLAPWGTSEGAGTICSDGLDNDGDGYADRYDDGCSASGGCSECHISLTPCDNCIDDDGDGLIDMADPGCMFPWDVSEGCSTRAALATACYADRAESNVDIVENMQAQVAAMRALSSPATSTYSTVGRVARLAAQAEAAAERALPKACDRQACQALKDATQSYKRSMQRLYRAVTRGGGVAKFLRAAKKVRTQAIASSEALLAKNQCW